MAVVIPNTAQGDAVAVTPGSEEEAKDLIGYTNPNLHRRVDLDEIGNKSYKLTVNGVNSYKIVSETLHDDRFPTTEPTSQNSNEIP